VMPHHRSFARVYRLPDFVVHAHGPRPVNRTNCRSGDNAPMSAAPLGFFRIFAVLAVFLFVFPVDVVLGLDALGAILASASASCSS
jgi:hypothetical protein